MNGVSLKLQVHFLRVVWCMPLPVRSVSLGSWLTVATVLLVHRNPSCPVFPACPTCPSCSGGCSDNQLHLALRRVPSDKWLSWSIFALGPYRVTLDDAVAEIIQVSYSWRRRSRALRPTCVARPILQTERAWVQCRIVGVVAEKESRRVMILTPDGDVHVEDASGQGRGKRGHPLERGSRIAFWNSPGGCKRIPMRARRRST